MDWINSPDADVEKAVHDIRLKHPLIYSGGLSRMQRFLDKLDNPHLRLPFVFHVAGTNGKGSVLAFLQAIFESGGLSVHKYISPHLTRFEERVVLNGKIISPDLLLSLIAEGSRAAGSEEVSFFEFLTGIAFLAYARHPADALLLETGLGGTNDATNIVQGEKIVSILTRISFDHTHILGKTLAEIAQNKAGIIKPGCACVIAPQPSPEAGSIFRQKADAVSAPVHQAGCGWTVLPEPGGFLYKSSKHEFHLPLPSLIGRHQIDNAGAALAALEESPYSFLMKREILEKAMSVVSWPGRLQRLERGPLADLLPPGWELWLDGAHNDSGAEVLAGQMTAWGDTLPLHLLMAMKGMKNSAEFYRPLLPHAATVTAIDVRHIGAPMMAPEALCDQIRKTGYTAAKTSPDLESAIRALVFQFRSPQRILIAGSLYLVGYALRDQEKDETAYCACR